VDTGRWKEWRGNAGGVGGDGMLRCGGVEGMALMQCMGGKHARSAGTRGELGMGWWSGFDWCIGGESPVGAVLKNTTLPLKYSII
jgi:hypothetical protein